MYTKTDYEKDRDLIRQYDGVKFEFPRTDTAGKKVNILYRIPHLDGLYIKTGSYGDSFMVCFDEPEYNLSNVKKEVDEYEKHRTILKQVQSAMDRVKEYESVNGEPEDTTGSGTAEPGEGGKNKKSNALKYAIPIERIDNKLWGKKLMKYAYADLRKLSKREKYTDNSLLQGINRQSSGYDQYRRIALTADKIDEKYVAYRLKPQ